MTCIEGVTLIQHIMWIFNFLSLVFTYCYYLNVITFGCFFVSVARCERKISRIRVIISNIIFERDPYLASGDKVSILAGMESPSSRSNVQSRLLSSRTQNTQGRLGDHLAHLTPVVPHTRAGQDTRAVSTETTIDIYSKTQLQETHQDTRTTVKYSFTECN